MNASPVNAIALDLHQLDAPYAQTRVQRPEQIRRLMASIDADGQRVPLVVVAEGSRWVLVDGYQRWAALQRLGRDTAQVEVWEGPLAAALVQVLARHQGRAFEPIEQAWVLSAALAEGLSQRALAAALGKDASWVSRRLALLSQLSEPVQEAVRQGVLPSWAASRVFVPLARANAADAESLLAALHNEPLSTRELATWYAHYGQANRTARPHGGPAAAVHPSLAEPGHPAAQRPRDAVAGRVGAAAPTTPAPGAHVAALARPAPPGRDLGGPTPGRGEDPAGT